MDWQLIVFKDIPGWFPNQVSLSGVVKRQAYWNVCLSVNGNPYYRRVNGKLPEVRTNKDGERVVTIYKHSRTPQRTFKVNDLIKMAWGDLV